MFCLRVQKELVYNANTRVTFLDYQKMDISVYISAPPYV